jgi:acetyl esterase
MAASDPAIESTNGVEFARPGGGPLFLDVHRVQGAERLLPAIVLVHGGRWSSGDKSEMTGTAQRWAARGYVVFNINYRLSTTHTYPAQIQDVRAAIGWVRAHGEEYGADPSSIGLFGGSAGGHLSLLAAMEDSDVRAVVSWSGPTDLGLMWAREQQTDAIGQLLGCDPREPCPGTRDASPITFVGPGDPPTLLANGSNERVPAEQAEVMAEALRSVGVPREVYIPLTTAHSWALEPLVEIPTKSFLERHLCREGVRPTVSISDASLTEEDGTDRPTFLLSLSSPTCRDVTVEFATEAASATGGADYEEVTGTVTIPAGELQGTVGVRVVDDAVDESEETFAVTLSQPTFAILGDAEGTGTITDDDGSTAILVGDLSVTEGDAGSADANVPGPADAGQQQADRGRVLHGARDGNRPVGLRADIWGHHLRAG